MSDILSFFTNLDPLYQALIAGSFAWFSTALGASFAFFGKKVERKILDWMLGASAGIMIAASFWSLLQPAVEMSREIHIPLWLAPVSGFIIGGITMRIIDKIIPHLHLFKKREEAEGISNSWKRSVLLVSAITMHNIPEGLAIGVAFGALSMNTGEVGLASALALAIGIAIQDFPEGLAVSMPLRREGFSRWKSFLCGQFSGLVEPIAALLGVILVNAVQNILPYALSFAAGAMIFVVVEELIPESQSGGNSDLATMGTIFGFALMMFLDIAFS